MYGIIFVILGNRTGNALVMGTYIMKAAGRPETPSEVRGIAASVLTVVCIIHAAWRKGGILLNNILAVVKVSILVAIIVIGFAALGGASFGHGKVAGYTIHPETLRKTSNFNVQSSFDTSTSDAASYVSAYIQILYTVGGFDQPFYVSGTSQVQISVVTFRVKSDSQSTDSQRGVAAQEKVCQDRYFGCFAHGDIIHFGQRRICRD